MKKAEKNKMDLLTASDVYRLIKDRLKKNDVNISVSDIKAVLEVYSEIIYAGLVNGVRVTVPNMGEFYRDKKNGRKAGYYNVPNSRDEHTKFYKNMEWHKEYMEKAPDYGRFAFAEYPRIKKKLREDTEGRV